MRLSEAEYAHIKAISAAKAGGDEEKVAPKPRKKRQRSRGERDLEMQLRAWQIAGWTTEFKFDAGTGGRGWRLDFSWPDLKLAVEVDGGVHRISGMQARDIEKHNALALAGWMTLRFSPEQCKSGEAVNTIKAALAARGGLNDE